MKTIPVIILLMAVFALSCNKKKKECVYKQVDKTELSGTLIEYDYGNNKEAVFARTMYKFQFYGDSFKQETWNITDIVTMDTCNENPYYEYIKGTWTLNGEQLNLRGLFTNENYGPKTSACHQSGEIYNKYSLYKCNDTFMLSYLPDKTTTFLTTYSKLHKQ